MRYPLRYPAYFLTRNSPLHVAAHTAIEMSTMRLAFMPPVPSTLRRRRTFPRMGLDGIAAANFSVSRVYCNDRLLATLQLADWRPYPDSKTLVDLPLRISPEEVLAEFEQLGDTPSAAAGHAFLVKAFHNDPNAALHAGPHIPIDYTMIPPSFVRSQPGSPQREFAAWLKRQWLTLSRSFGASSDIALSRSSLIALPHPFFVPGGRFRELYYWDSLWIVHGLLACDMRASAVNVVRNLLHLVRQFGFVPNGNRVYYLNRSQPPVLAAAVDAIYEDLAGDADAQIRWLREAVPMIEKEYRAFKEHRNALNSFGMGDDREYNDLLASLSVYNVATSTPRPSLTQKMYIQQAVRATALTRHVCSATLHQALRAGGISQRAGETCLCRTRAHAHIARAYRHEAAGDARARAMAALIFHTAGMGGAHIVAGWGEREAKRFVRAVTSVSGLLAKGGLAATNTTSTQQWDFPNSWPPLVDFAVDALRRLNGDFPSCGAGAAAEDLAQRTLRAMYRGWRAGGGMHEKYDATDWMALPDRDRCCETGYLALIALGGAVPAFMNSAGCVCALAYLIHERVYVGTPVYSGRQHVKPL
eukprot:IDg9565t1